MPIVENMSRYLVLLFTLIPFSFAVSEELDESKRDGLNSSVAATFSDNSYGSSNEFKGTVNWGISELLLAKLYVRHRDFSGVGRRIGSSTEEGRIGAYIRNSNIGKIGVEVGRRETTFDSGSTTILNSNYSSLVAEGFFERNTIGILARKYEYLESERSDSNSQFLYLRGCSKFCVSENS